MKNPQFSRSLLRYCRTDRKISKIKPVISSEKRPNYSLISAYYNFQNFNEERFLVENFHWEFQWRSAKYKLGSLPSRHIESRMSHPKNASAMSNSGRVKSFSKKGLERIIYYRHVRKKNCSSFSTDEIFD